MLNAAHGVVAAQVADITGLGSLSEVAGLLLPRGAVLLGTSTETVPLPARSTQLGEIQVPPRTYYRWGGWG